MKRILAFTGLTLALALCGTVSAADYYVTDDGGYVYDTDNTWYDSAPVDTYGYYDPGYTYVTPDPYYDNWYGGVNVGIGLNFGDRDRDYWRHSHFDGDRRGSGFRSSTGFTSGSRSSGVRVRSSGRSSGGHRR